MLRERPNGEESYDELGRTFFRFASALIFFLSSLSWRLLILMYDQSAPRMPTLVSSWMSSTPASSGTTLNLCGVWSRCITIRMGTSLDPLRMMVNPS